MRRLETKVIINPDHTLNLRLPKDIPPGEHRVVLIIDTPDISPHQADAEQLDLPQLDLGPWSDTLSLRREDLYEQSDR